MQRKRGIILEEKLIQAIQERLGNGYDVYTADRPKNNRKEHTLNIVKKSSVIGISIPADKLLAQLEKNSMSFDEALEQVMDTWNHAENNELKKVRQITEGINKKRLLSSSVCCLVGKENNRELLSKATHMDFLDLAVVYRSVISQNGKETTSFLITDALCETCGVTIGELDEAARKNSESFGFEILNMADVIASMSKCAKEEIPGHELAEHMYILRNKNDLIGDNVLLYPQLFEELARKAGDDLYIFPSSIYEVIAVPVEGVPPDGLYKMVGDINQTELSEDEILSDSVYKYSRKTGKISLVEIG